MWNLLQVWMGGNSGDLNVCHVSRRANEESAVGPHMMSERQFFFPREGFIMLFPDTPASVFPSTGITGMYLAMKCISTINSINSRGGKREEGERGREEEAEQVRREKEIPGNIRNLGYLFDTIKIIYFKITVGIAPKCSVLDTCPLKLRTITLLKNFFCEHSSLDNRKSKH